jgi:hypothetical protein
MLQGRYIAFAGVLVVAVLVAAVALIQLANGNGNDDDGLAAPPPAPGDPDGTPAADDFDDELDLEGFGEEQFVMPPEVQAFLEEFALANSVLHFTLEQEAAEQEDAPEAETYAIGDFWIEIDDEVMPSRLVVRFFDRDGEMLEAIYSDGEEEVVALIEETRRGAQLEQGCIHRGPASLQLFMQTLPFVIEGAVLEMEGFEGASDRVEGSGPSTDVDDRVGDPQRVLSMSLWLDAEQYEREEAEQPLRAMVIVDPETRVLIGQALLQANDDGEEVQFRQAMGDIHVHERGTTEDLFDFQDALNLCEELES